MTKCEGLWIGKDKERQNNSNLLNIKWPKEPIRFLGIFTGHNKASNERLNWLVKLQGIDIFLELWKCRNLTLFGKVTIIKQLAIPKILFVATMLPIPDGIIKKINALLYGFIWGKRDRIRMKVLISDVAEGGVNMIDIESLFHSVKDAWVLRLIKSQPEEQWTMFAEHYLKYSSNDEFFPRLNFIDITNVPFMKNLPAFY